MPVKQCAMCSNMIEGAAQRRYCPPCRKSRHRATIRQLRPGEAIPKEKPRRYTAGHGYIRLRWRVAPYEYVETYEHRVINGRITDAGHVHHINRNVADNRPSNLRPLSAEDHALEHGRPNWWIEAAQLYVIHGWSTYKIGKALSHDPATVYRALKSLNVELRSSQRIAIPKREQREAS